MKSYSKKSKKETPTFSVAPIRRTTAINVFSDEEKAKEPVIEESTLTMVECQNIFDQQIINQAKSAGLI
jgi:hypothetical protein